MIGEFASVKQAHDTLAAGEVERAAEILAALLDRQQAEALAEAFGVSTKREEVRSDETNRRDYGRPRYRDRC